MPECPEIDALAEHLRRHALGTFVVSLQLGSLSALRTVAPPLEAYAGAEVERVSRRGKYLVLEIGGLALAVHFARAGWLRWYDRLPQTRLRPGKGPVALRVDLGGAGMDFTEAGTKKALGVWCATSPDALEPLAELGPEAADLGQEGLAALLSAAGRRRLKTILTDQKTIAGLGNGLSDEVAHRARLSPYALSDGLSEAEVAALHTAIQAVLDEFRALREMPPERVKAGKKALMVIHGRAGEACPVCGTTIASVSFAETSLEYCPGCQTHGRRLADRRMDRLLK